MYHDVAEHSFRCKNYPIAIPILFGVLIGIATFGLMSGSVSFESVKNNPVIDTMIGIVGIAEVSAYTASEDETDANPTEMASGRTIYPGAIACPSRLAFGTRVVIENTTYVCEDRMAKRYRDKEHFDILVGSKQEAREFGRKKLETVVIQ